MATNSRQSEGKIPAAQSDKLESSVAEGVSPQDSTAGGAGPPDTISLPESVSYPEAESPDVIIEEYLREDKGVCFWFYTDTHTHIYYSSIYTSTVLHLPVAAPPTGPELPHERCKPLRREKNKCKKKILGKEKGGKVYCIN